MKPRSLSVHLGLLLLAVLPLLGFSARAQPAPPALTIRDLMDAASATYPTLLASRLEARASAEEVVAAERQRWPTISATVESNTGNFRSTPSRGLQIEQVLWDGGRNTALINEAVATADVGFINVYLQQQDIFLQIVSAWQSMVASVQRFEAAQRNQKRLREYQAQMQRRVAAEASPRIDLELADARLLQTDVELTVAQTSMNVAMKRLEQLSGLDNLAHRIAPRGDVPTLDDSRSFSEQLDKTDWMLAASEHPSVAKARIGVELARRRADAKSAESWPQVFVRSYQPIGSTVASPDNSMTTFLGLRYSPGAGFSTLAHAQAMATRIASAEQAIEAAIKEAQQTLQTDQEEFVSARARIHAMEKSVLGAALVLDSYQRQFQGGRKSWQDLLNAVRELAQNEYALADARAAMVGAMFRLQVRMGQPPH